MKPSLLKKFVRGWLEARGLSAGEHTADLWSFSVPRGLREKLGRKELMLAFTQRAMSKHERSELATVGNPVFDRLIGIARDEGRIGIGFTKAPGRHRPPAAEKVGSIEAIAPRKGEPTYQAIYHMVFTVTYPSIEAADEMEVMSVDGGTLDVLAQTPDLTQLWNRLEPNPQKGRSILPPIPIEDVVIDTGLKALEKRMRRRINKVRKTSQVELERETNSIEVYYQQLIEEARNQSRRWTTKAEDRETRVHWLQLEWKRRIEEANEFWRPQVNARFAGLGIQMVPTVAYRYPVSKGKGRAVPKGPVRVWDVASRKLLVPFCAACGRTGLEEPRITNRGRFVCGDCAEKEPPAKGRKVAARQA